MLTHLARFLLLSVALSLVVGVGILTYAGITPLSVIFGTGQVDLGITTTPAQTDAAIQKVGTTIVTLPPDTPAEMGFRLEGTQTADFFMDSQEISAHSNRRPWKNYPLKNVQIKIHENGDIEASAQLLVEKAMPYAMGLGYSESQIREAMSKYSIPPVSVPIYVYGQGSVVANQPFVNASTLKIGGYTLPNDIVNNLNTAAEAVIADVIHKHQSAFNCESLTFGDSKLHFKGAVAQTQFVVSE